MEAKDVKDIEDLSTLLLSRIQKFHDGKIGVSEIKEDANAMGKIDLFHKHRMEYNKLKKANSSVPFYECSGK